MSNKIIKISIVLIFMLFSSCLFNFCFAAISESDLEVVDTIVSYNDSGTTTSVPLYKSNFSYIECPTEHEYKLYYYDTYDDLLKCFVSNKPLVLLCNRNDWRLYLHEVNEDGSYGVLKCDRYTYNSNTAKWSFNKTFNAVGNMNISECLWLLDYSDPNLYGYATSENTDLVQLYPNTLPSIDMKVVQTGTKTGHVEFTKVNWDSPHMYYVKGNKEDLQELKNNSNLSTTHSQVKYYDGPVSIEYGEYVLGLLFDNGELVFSEISDSVTINYDILTDNSHKLYIDKENENMYYLSIHGYQDGDYLKISDVPIENDAFSNHYKILDNLSASLEYNGLSIGQAYETSLGHKNRKITLSKNGVTYFYLYDVNNNLINCVVINSSNYYSGEEFNFDVELQYGSSNSNSNEIRWVKIIPRINVSSIDNYELYLKISDYGNIPYIQEEDRCIFATHDINGNDYLGVDIGTNSNTAWYRIDNKISDYFYINTFTHDSTFTFELQLRSGLGQVIETKSFKVNLSSSNKVQGTISSSTNGKNDTYIRDPEELSGIVSNSNKFDFSGLNDLSETDLKTNVNGLIDNSIGFFGLVSTFLLLLPTWISSLLYLFFFGIIVITLLRFIRGS